LKVVAAQLKERAKSTLAMFWSRLRGSHLSPRGVALSVGVGLMVGLCPLYGMHGVLVMLVCLPLRLDAALAFAATMISNPLTLPFLVALELQIGAALVGGAQIDVQQVLSGEQWSQALLQLALGSGTLGVAVAGLGAFVVFKLVRRWRQATINGA